MPVAKPIRFNDLYPPAPEGRENVKWQGDDADPANVSAHIPAVGAAGGNGILAGALSSQPAAGTEGRIFIPIDQPVGHPDFYWDSGTVWVAYLNFRPIVGNGGGAGAYLGLQSTLII